MDAEEMMASDERATAVKRRVAEATAALSGGAERCYAPLECGGLCMLQKGHDPPCLCVGDEGDGCPA